MCGKMTKRIIYDITFFHDSGFDQLAGFLHHFTPSFVSSPSEEQLMSLASPVTKATALFHTDLS
jgi:hypothetical protein